MEYVPRLTCPEKTDKNFIVTSKGGKNKCINISNGWVLHNCVGYVWGRWLELLAETHKLSTNNANTFYTKNDGYKRGQTPKLGAVICWDDGKCGHVAIVEKINADGSILISQSGYTAKKFWTQTLTSPYALSGYKLQGFIYLPVEYEQSTTTDYDVEYQAYDNVRKKWWSVIKNYNETNTNGYAGVIGHSLGGLRVRLTNGANVTVKSHIKGGSWLSPITKWDNTSSGYSGLYGKEIDKVMIKADVPIKYRAHIKGGSWLSWITDYNENNTNGYAGITGKVIDAIQISKQ